MVERLCLAVQMSKLELPSQFQNDPRKVYGGLVNQSTNSMTAAVRSQILSFVTSFLSRPVCKEELGWLL